MLTKRRQSQCIKKIGGENEKELSGMNILSSLFKERKKNG